MDVGGRATQEQLPRMPGIYAALNKPFNRQNSTHIRAGPHALPRQLLLHRLNAPTFGALLPSIHGHRHGWA